MQKLSLWRYVVILAALALGLIYALPNLYGEDPAVQVALKSGAPIAATDGARVKKLLATHQISYKNMHTDAKGLWVLFANTDMQMTAQDYIRQTLGNDYTVSISLVPRTPHWLQALGAEPMKLGLDLRGGIHFLLQVDLTSVMQRRLQGDMRAMTGQLRDQSIAYTAATAKPVLDVNTTPVFTLVFANTAALNKARAYLVPRYRDYVFQVPAANQLQGTMSATALTTLQQGMMAQNMQTLTSRVNALGISEATVQRQGLNQISLDLPGIQDTARAKQLIGKVANLEFRMVDTTHNVAQAVQSGIIPVGTQLFYDDSKPVSRPYLLKSQVILRGNNIVSATADISQQNGRPEVAVRVGSGVAHFHQVTAANIKKPMAVIYKEVVTTPVIKNGKTTYVKKHTAKIISVATVQQALANNFVITGLSSMHYAQDLALQLRSGAYTADVTIVQNMTVGPTMGAANIRHGVLSTAVGALLVFIFMAIYYRLFGLIADMALFLNLIFIVAVLSLLGATLTLAGIAGIVLTLGMAVDANVLINERIREELRQNMSPFAAINAGYDRAFATIVDANLTTLIVAVVLLSVSSPSIKSFAINLIIGLVTSMITAIFFTRSMVSLFYNGRRKVKRLSIGI